MRKTLKNVAWVIVAVPLFNATPQMNAHITTAFAALSRCVAAVAAEQTRGIVIADSRDILGSAYDGVAYEDGFIILDRWVSKWVILHELGHEVAMKFDLVQGRFARAVRADFRSLDVRERKRLDYFRDPDEAFAELFAALYDSEDIAAENSQIMRLARARAVEKSLLDGLKGCGLEE
jgi:hypothetical protein